MHRASRYRLYPNRTQERQFARLCGAGRFVYDEGVCPGLFHWKAWTLGG